MRKVFSFILFVVLLLNIALVSHANNDKYVLATDDDFESMLGNWTYLGSDDYVIIPDTINGEDVRSYKTMFISTSVKGVRSDNPNVKDMTFMFANNKSESLDVSGLDTKSIYNMYGVFETCKAKSLDLSTFDTSNVWDMRQMFDRCEAETIDLSSFDTSSVRKMYAMFRSCKVKNLDLSHFDTNKVDLMMSMFEACESETIDISSFDFTDANVEDMFKDCMAKTVYVNSSADINLLKTSGAAPSSLKFEVKKGSSVLKPVDKVDKEKASSKNMIWIVLLVFVVIAIVVVVLLLNKRKKA